MSKKHIFLALSLMMGLPKVAFAAAEGAAVFAQEASVLFKCSEGYDSYTEALAALTASLNTPDGRVVSIAQTATEGFYVFVQSPFSVSAPTFFEDKKLQYACVTVQSTPLAKTDG